MTPAASAPPAGADEQRMRHVFEIAYDDLCRFVRRRIVDGDDIVAETFLIAWRRIADLPGDDGEARAWLFGTARKLMANRRRKDARLVAWSPGDADSSGPDDIADRTDATGATEARIDLSRAFARLPAADQEVLALVAWDGLTTTEAAAVLEISASAFAVRLHRARRRLRAAMDEPRSFTIPTGRFGRNQTGSQS